MQINIEQVYHFSCTSEEMLLICKALGGRLRDHEIEQARDLDDLIAHIRIQNAENLNSNIQKLKRNLEGEN